MPGFAEMNATAAAGIDYPIDPTALGQELSLYLESAPLLTRSQPIRSLIVPFDPMSLTGGVSARAYRQIFAIPWRCIVLLAPVEAAQPMLTLYSARRLKTILGQINIDFLRTREFENFHDLFKFDKNLLHIPRPFELQLPYLRWMPNPTAIIPIGLATQSPQEIEVLVHAFSSILDPEKDLVVAVSNLSRHYSDRRARARDEHAVERINQFQSDALYEDLLRGICEMDGFGAVVTAMRWARHCGAERGDVLIYRNSGDITGDLEKVNGYLSAMFY